MGTDLPVEAPAGTSWQQDGRIRAQSEGVALSSCGGQHTRRRGGRQESRWEAVGEKV